MGNKGRKGRIEDRPSAFPSEDHGLFIVVQTFLRHPAVILESILMSPDQSVKVTMDRKVDVLTAWRNPRYKRSIAPGSCQYG